MRDDRPSRTSARVALRRAAHQLLDDPPVFRDPLALRILGPEAREALRDHPDRFDRRPFASWLRAFLAVRSRVAEDALAEAVAAGACQYVVLGAGLDTFALRNPYLSLRVFEVDHPTTQAWKRRRIREAQLVAPPGLAFVPVDFERDALAEALARAGFAADQPTFVSWLGVTPYLEKSTILATLGWVAGVVGASGGVVFDYRARPGRFSLLHRWLLGRLAARVAAAGEPFRSSFEPAEMLRELRHLGFTRIENLGAVELNARYFTGRSDGLRVRGPGRLAIAGRVASGAPGS